LWGGYFCNDENRDILSVLELCEGGKFVIFDSILSIEYNYDGYYKNDSLITLFDISGLCLMELEIIDTLNYLVIKSTLPEIIEGSYFHKESSYFQGHSCGIYLENLSFVRWIIIENNDSLGKKEFLCYYVSQPKKFYVIDYEEIKTLPITIYK